MSQKRFMYVQKDWPVRVGMSSFTMPKDARLEILQRDISGKKILLDFGLSTMDWIHINSVLEYCIEGD